MGMAPVALGYERGQNPREARIVGCPRTLRHGDDGGRVVNTV